MIGIYIGSTYLGGGVLSLRENLILFLFLPTIGVIFYCLGNKFKGGMKKSFINKVSLFLIMLDQLIKLICLNIKIFVRNELYSTFNQIFHINLSILSLITINLFLLIICIWGYKIHIKEFGKSLWSDLFIVFTCSGLICSLFDKMFWNGSIDFIHFNSLIIFDCKDIYLVLSFFLLISELILNEKIDLFTK